MLLQRGNSKTGAGIYQFSIPAGDSCPGKTALCDERCYAQKGFFVMPNVQARLERNFASSKLANFPMLVTEELLKHKVTIMRIHVAGDFYSLAYVKKWIEIVKANPTVIFFAYTRSWRLPNMRPLIEELGKLPNMRMWFSLDRETGDPGRVPKGIRTAYMSVAIHDTHEKPVNLYFRDYPIRGIIQKRIEGSLVCPPENGITHTTCEKCGVCYRRKDTPAAEKPRATSNKRVPLQLVG